ncbi:hypothetical protein CcaverHIS002_0505400 [Cutaneotrichosporon cavernicola]|uniref:DUF1754-domain-containing protein n=1 Tax=Cutaneotrichosporon cavernicola TaxID=279322 RepID=A0AA48L6N6_9TREE|nr:uncharacterized protein CcaverHIS019_0505920 [Cutaneotrichosporon cavernicola]BEI85139.1 hypothetical protein CcaverHIS002_0505400 [Cutaneotrichosporon cavernicola]BEI92964.1 hypothetical protein CcaverHIS019_0505920 [Cutaneotrichosporon cavernicola]BEJ00740.1 hypothetical protein CcaverHIS631_0505970 [Cutaneotrichosporon cavernicola]BEJ08506.1 hypothetical protein CcaverHIS641_0506000 [Cutaneotrichosporon cavernicola]
MSDYAVPRPGGSLKFKGDSDKKKKKKKSHAPDDRARKEADVTIAAESSKRGRDSDNERSGDRDERRRDRRGSASASASPAPPPSGSSGRRITEAERRFEEVQRKRRDERVKKTAHLSHKDRVAQLNARLDSMSEHYDMPRIGPG